MKLRLEKKRIKSDDSKKPDGSIVAVISDTKLNSLAFINFYSSF